MANKPIREPEELRQSCIAKIKSHVELEPQQAALAYLLDDKWTERGFAELALDWDGDVLGRREDEKDFHEELCSLEDFGSYVIYRAKLAGLDGDEQGYLLGRAVTVKRKRVLRNFQ